MRIKDNSVRVRGMGVEIAVALMIADQVYSKHGFDCVLTSADDGSHSRTSLHYSGNAIDLRRYYENFGVVVEEIKKCLNKDYDVVLEGNHLHIEYQPKRR